MVFFPKQSLKLLIAFAGKDLSHYFDEFSKPRIRLTKSGNFVPLFVPTIENAEGFFSKTQSIYLVFTYIIIRII